MMKRRFRRALLAPLAFVTACSSQSAVAPATSTDPIQGGPSLAEASSSPHPQEPSCAEVTGQVCHPDGFPFAQIAAAVTDVCSGPVDSCPLGTNPPAGETTAQLTQPEPGKICLAGSVGADGWSQVLIGFSQVNAADNRILKTFDAAALGITQVGFTIESPPSAGIIVDAAINSSLSCPEDFLDCMTWGFNLMTAPDSAMTLSITTPSRIVAPLTQFKQTRLAPAATVFDTHAIEHFSFGVGSGAYDFCVSELQFMDAAGQVVNPG